MSKALKRLRTMGIETDGQRLAHLETLPRRPHWPCYFFHAPNPDHWVQEAKFPHWLTGEAAAAFEGLDLVPARLEVYVRRVDTEAALLAAKRAFAKISSGRDANLIVRVADPWLHLRPDEPLVERGQRLYDYARSKNIQFAKEMERLE